jgi:hypothetical protein
MQEDETNSRNKTSLSILEIHSPGEQPRFDGKHIPTSVFCKYTNSYCLLYVNVVLKQEHPALAGSHPFGLIKMAPPHTDWMHLDTGRSSLICLHAVFHGATLVNSVECYCLWKNVKI